MGKLTRETEKAILPEKIVVSNTSVAPIQVTNSQIAAIFRLLSRVLKIEKALMNQPNMACEDRGEERM
jgi:hypothetical protein